LSSGRLAKKDGKPFSGKLVLVNSAPGFTEPHEVANGASELFLEVFGERGAHARSAFGATQIPFGSCVEIEIIVEVSDSDSECQV
jgi:enamine deaminase RidA (YjgF/YER057c/UK114 family)